MRLIPFCHQWILKIFSRSDKLFVNHKGSTVKIRFNFQGQEVSGEFKWGIVWISPPEDLQVFKGFTSVCWGESAHFLLYSGSDCSNFYTYLNSACKL